MDANSWKRQRLDHEQLEEENVRILIGFQFSCILLGGVCYSFMDGRISGLYYVGCAVMILKCFCYLESVLAYL